MDHHQQQQPCDFFNVFSKNNVSKDLQGSSSSSASIQQVSTELSLSPTFSSVPSFFTKTRNTNNRNRNSSSSYSNNTKTCHDERNNISDSSSSSSASYGCSVTALKLYDDPWKIKKVLTASDLGKLNRLLLSSDSMEDLVVSVMGNRNSNSNNLLLHLHDHHRHRHRHEIHEELLIKGRAVRVWHVETKSMHQLVLKRWASFKNYVLIGNWNQDFVKRRSLKKGDEIGLQWDPYNFCFNFSVLKRSPME